MRDVGLSPDAAEPRIVDSFQACLSSVLEIPLADLPWHEKNLRAAVTEWRTWLAGRCVGYDLTLIEAEVLDELTLTDGQQLGYAEARRNIITRGIDLNALVGQRFKVGDVECVGRRLCEPCAHLERLTYRGVLRKLIHRGGLRADILTAGSITVGAPIECLDQDQFKPPGETPESAAI